jgi:agmatinase
MFDPSGVAQDNGNLIGLPYTEEEAKIVLVPAPWEVTVSYSAGTAKAGENIRRASLQLDLYDPDVPDAWRIGLFMRPTHAQWMYQSDLLRARAKKHIDFLESGGHLDASPERRAELAAINLACAEFKSWVYHQTGALLDRGKLVGLVGGDHSTPLGYLEALAERHPEFGVLHVDAHLDMRAAYEGFTYSHASIFYNALQLPQISHFVSVGIRDWCEEEMDFVAAQNGRVEVFYDHEIRRAQYQGQTFQATVQQILRGLPEKVYVSFDIDGLDPRYCPGTGTPVPGGLDFPEAVYLLSQIVASGRRIIGFDLSEVGVQSEWDGNVGARLLYKLANLMGSSLDGR